MKKIIFILILILSAAYSALAVPAAPGNSRRVKQPDGSVIILQNHGDEYFNWITDQNGRIVEKKADGFYREVDMATHMARRNKAMAIRPRRTWSTYETAPETNFGDRKILCIIANFTDSTFVLENPRQKFHNLLNQEGYSDNGSIGSVRDYYIDNSRGLYRPMYDVYGPAQLTHSNAWYKTNGVYKAVIEAYEQLAAEIPINDYDTDGDGIIDMVLFYYPGHNPAEGAGQESIWPHQSTGTFGYMGSKLFNRYFCTSELRNVTGKDMCNIGTTCHEFAHALGLPDFYDTDYEANGSNKCNADNYDLMSGGNYLDGGRRPPYLNALERNMLGWMPNPEELPSGEITIEPVRNNVAYKVPAIQEGEFFTVECRDNYKWDSGIPMHFKEDGGLLVYNVDKSQRMIVGAGKTAEDLWSTNKINAYGGEPCCWPLSSFMNKTFYFPGSYNVSQLAFTDKDGVPNGITLKGITFDGEKVHMSCVKAQEATIYGLVVNSAGEPIPGALLSLSKPQFQIAPRRIGLKEDITGQTDSDGYYSLTLPDDAGDEYVLSVTAEGYIPVSINLTLTDTKTCQKFIMTRYYEGDANLQHYNPDMEFHDMKPHASQIAMSMLYDPIALERLGVVGSRIDNVTFLCAAETRDKVYVIVEIQGQDARFIDVSDIYVPGEHVTADISTENIIIPENAWVRIGYGLEGLDTSEYSLSFYGFYDSATDGGYIAFDFSQRPMTWYIVNFGGKYANYVISAKTSSTHTLSFADFGAAYIRVEDGVPTIVPAGDRTVYKTEWLQEGPKTYVALITYYDGTTERVYLDLE